MSFDYLSALGIQQYVVRGGHRPVATSEANTYSSVNKASPVQYPQTEPEQEAESTPVVNDSWSAIIGDLQSQAGCPNCQQCAPILGEGDQQAKFVVVVDAPTVRDISEQKILSGRDGQLMDAMLAALGLNRETIYLSSIFKCAPSENYQVGPTCNDLLPRQLNLIGPEKILVLGEFAAQTLLRSNDPLSILRSKTHQPRALTATVGVTASITEILSKPSCKGEVWKDLCRLVEA